MSYLSLLEHVMVICVLYLPHCCSQLIITAADGLKLKTRAARFADTLGSSEAPKVRMEPLLLSRQNVSLVIINGVVILCCYHSCGLLNPFNTVLMFIVD